MSFDQYMKEVNKDSNVKYNQSERNLGESNGLGRNSIQSNISKS